ncbi:TPA: hypothetical protein QCH54_004009 [Enterobacter ludwigii]|nr:hypothetical protein [Enterobacter ludwigii]
MTKDEIINGLLEREAGYVNHPSDKGGPTNRGITAKTALAHGYSDVRSLTKEQARAIYEADYWYGPRFDHLHKAVLKYTIPPYSIRRAYAAFTRR